MQQSTAWPQSRKIAPTEQDRQSAEALKKEGNAYFGKAKYGAAIEVLAATAKHAFNCFQLPLAGQQYT